MIGDNTDMWGRLKNLLPVGWFGDNNPIRDALLWGYANALAWGYTLYLYAKDQTRIKSATDGWLDLIGLDFFGNNLIRYANQSDASYKNRILINIFRERTTRHAMEQVLYDLTGRWPVIVEPARPADVGSYGAAVAVSRASTATFYDLNGLLATAQPNVARYDTNPSTGLSSLLLEDASTNIAIRSQEFDVASWAKIRASVSANVIAGPDGTVTADKLVVDSTPTSTHSAGQSTGVSVAVGVPVTISVFLKAVEIPFVYLQLRGGGGTAFSASNGRYFNISTGVAGFGSAGSTYTIDPLPSGWFRISHTFTSTQSGTIALDIFAAYALSAGSISGNGDGVSGFYLWGAQIEVGAAPTSYIPTTTVAVTRAADILLNNMPVGSIAIGGYGVAGAYGSVLHPYQAFVTAFRPNGQGLPFISGYGISTGAYSTPSRSAYGQLSGGDVTDADIYAAIDATKPVGTVVWTRISS